MENNALTTHKQTAKKRETTKKGGTEQNALGENKNSKEAPSGSFWLFLLVASSLLTLARVASEAVALQAPREVRSKKTLAAGDSAWLRVIFTRVCVGVELKRVRRVEW